MNLGIASNIFRHNKNRRSNLDRRKQPDSYNNFVRTLILVWIFIFGLEPFMSIFAFLKAERKPQTEDWIFYQYKSKEQYARQITKRKIIIAAGSSASFGISATQIEAETGIPAVNLGVHAGLGIKYILDRSHPILKPGDIVVLPLEFPLYHTSRQEQLLSQPLRNYIISYDRDYLNRLDLTSKLKVLLYSPGLSQEFLGFINAALKNPSLINFDKKKIYESLSNGDFEKDCFSEKMLDKNGDQTCNVGKLPLASIKNEIDINPNPKQPIDRDNSLKEFCTFAKNNNITIIPLYPTVLYRSHHKSTLFEKYFRQIHDFWVMQGIPFEDSPEKSLIEEKMMFNSSWHPNDKGRKIRTSSIINILKSHI